MENFAQKVVVISGATRGIGKAIAESFLKAEAYVVGIYAGNTAAARQFELDYSRFSSQFELVQCDVSVADEVQQLFTKLELKFDSIDILINNAGIRRDSVLALMASEDWNRVIDINLSGTYLMCKQAVLLMMKKRYGRIINITSPVAHLGFVGQANYAASKAGQIALTKTLAKEIAKKKITVNCVSPGFIATDFINDLSPEQVSSYKKMVPMRRFGKPAEIAESVLFLASDRAAYITGAVLEISGGL